MFRMSFRPDAELVLLEEHHAPLVYAAVERNREHLREWLPWVDATHSADTVATFIRKSLEQFARNEGFHAGIFEKGEFRGSVGFKPINWSDSKTEIGYWLEAGAQGRGLMTGACRAVIDHAFGHWNLHRIEIRVGVGNQKSAAIPQRLGFKLEGTERESFRVNGHLIDTERYAMLRPEWLSV